MGIGGALARARSTAGLTVTQVSERTRIRATIIRDIERDDYGACGGDYYARGHIRAIARVVGTDPVPLIAEYDAVHQPPPDPAEVSYAAQAPGWRIPGWHRHPAGGTTGDGFDHHDGNEAARPAVSRNGAGPARLTTSGTASPAGIGADDDTDPGLSLTAAHAPTRTQPMPDGAAPDGAAPDGAAPDGAAPDGAAPDDGPRQDTALPDPAAHDPAAHDPAARDLAAHDPAAHDPAAHNPVVQDPVGTGVAAGPPGGGQAAMNVRATGANALESAGRWAATARSRLARPPEPEGSGVPGGITAAEAFRPAMPLEPRRTGGRRWLLVVLVLAVIGLLIYFLVSGGSSPGKSGATHHSHHSSASASRSHHSTTASASPSGSASASASPAIRPLTIASAAAFGPSGTGQGDNPSQAGLAIDGSHSTAWHTDWYTTSSFSGMQQGTGLLLDLGRSESVARVTIQLGSVSGGTIQLRAGDTPALAGLPDVASVPDSGGSLTVKLISPVAARYVLIWFTSLPPDSSGTYQASIYNVSLSGTS